MLEIVFPQDLPGLPSAIARRLPCKVCSAEATLAGFVDFARDVYDYNRCRGLVSGIPVPYYRCAQCRLGFTTSFDSWSNDDFRRHVYNDTYHLYDPRYAVERPKKTTSIVQTLLPSRGLSILDYGSGNGLTTSMLRESGYRTVETYDPYNGNSERPDGQFDVVLSMEVAEHSTRPLELFSELNRLCRPKGVILFSTKDFSTVPGYWLDDGYVAPRNGHVTLYSIETLDYIARSLGRRFKKLDTYRHLFLPPE